METTSVGRRSQGPEALATPFLWASVTEGLCVQSALDLRGERDGQGCKALVSGVRPSSA